MDIEASDAIAKKQLVEVVQIAVANNLFTINVPWTVFERCYRSYDLEPEQECSMTVDVGRYQITLIPVADATIH